MDERELWLKISNSSAAIAGRPSRLLLRIRSSSASAAIRRLSAARHAARRRRTNNRAAAAGSHRSSTQSTVVTCSGCGQQTTVPFEPRGDRPVYCQNLLSKPEDQHGRRQPAKLWQGPLEQGVCSVLRAVAFDFEEGERLSDSARAACACFDSLTTVIPRRRDRAGLSHRSPLSRLKLDVHRSPRSSP